MVGLFFSNKFDISQMDNTLVSKLLMIHVIALCILLVV